MPIVETPDGPRLVLQGTIVLEKNLRCQAGTVVNRGGTRSSKTYSIAQIFISRLFNCRRRRMLIARKTFPALRTSVMHDALEILHDEGLYHLVDHNKAEHVLRYDSNEIVFASIDDPQKIRSASWNDAWLAEGNEFDYEDYRQLDIRMTRPVTDGLPNQIFLDFNPDDPDHWIKTELEDKGRCETIVSTYQDNPFISDTDRAKIEWLEENDPDFWNVFGLGLYGKRNKGIIYQKWDTYSTAPGADDPVYGLDFGFNKPAALGRVDRAGNDLYIEQLIYQTELTNPELIALMKEVIPNRRSPIYADNAEPKSIEEIRQAGFNIHPADKAVLEGIKFVKRFRLHLHIGSEDLKKEARSYKWKEDKNGDPLDEPLKFRDHLMDAIRYAIYTHGSKYWTERMIGKAAAPRPKRRKKKDLLPGY